MVGGGSAHAYIDSLARHLPDPLLYDEDMRKFEKALREDERDSLPPSVPQGAQP